MSDKKAFRILAALLGFLILAVVMSFSLMANGCMQMDITLADGSNLSVLKCAMSSDTGVTTYNSTICDPNENCTTVNLTIGGYKSEAAEVAGALMKAAVR